MLRAVRLAPWLVAAASGALLVAVAARADAPAGRYTLTAATVLDTKTGLTWQRAPTTSDGGGTIATLSEAQQACAAPWRLPEIKELETLVDESKTVPPFIDSSAFPSTPNVPFWSNTLSNTLPDDYRVFVLHPDGTSSTIYLNGSQSSGAYVRCVQP